MKNTLSPVASPLAVAIAFALFSSLSLPVLAAPDAKELETIDVVGSRPTNYDEKQTSTATRTNTALRDVPQAITVVTQEVIQDQAMHGVGDALQYVPGVGVAQGEGNRDTPILRGSSTTADFFLDGLRDDVQYLRDLYNIDRVEALKGPNAMIFGRGGSGGVVNRVGKLADGNAHRDLSLQLGSWNRRRIEADLGGPTSDSTSFRVAAMGEDSESYRDGFEIRRYGINPSFTWRGDASNLVLTAEHFDDERVADRGVPSFGGRPVDVDPSTFFGSAALSPVRAQVDSLGVYFEHDFNDAVTLRNRTRAAHYDKFYQNVYPSAVSADGGTVTLQTYNNATERSNLFNQTDLIIEVDGRIHQTLLAGVELGRQVSDNYRQTGFFPADTCASTGSTAFCLPIDNPRYEGTVDFRNNLTSDADNHGVAHLAAVYVQNQIEFSPHWEAVVGLRYDRFQVDFTSRTDLANGRTGRFDVTDNLLSPRAGLVFKPFASTSIYANYSLAYVPRSGDQMSSLNATNAAFEPEKFTNVELGAKWNLTPDLSATFAIYRLDRRNVVIADPVDPTRSLLVKGQRARGVELGLSGRVTEHWKLIGGYARQEGELLERLSATAPDGATLAQLPEHTFSLWNRVDFNDAWGVGLGAIHRSSLYPSTDNAVTVPGYTRFDGAVYFAVNDRLRLQLNAENLFDREYFVSANSNSNITPGSPRAFYLEANFTF
jgi:catecholate siderophore receptor